MTAATEQNEKDNDVIRANFKENDSLLKALRALFLGLEVTKAEKETIQTTFKNEDLRRIVRTKFYPMLSRETPIGQVADVWLGVEQQIFNVSRDTIEQAIKYKDLALDYTEMAMNLLVNPDGERPLMHYSAKVAFNDGSDPLGIKLLARNQYIRHVETQLTSLWIIANQNKAENKPQIANTGTLKKSSSK